MLVGGNDVCVYFVGDEGCVGFFSGVLLWVVEVGGVVVD